LGDHVTPKPFNRFSQDFAPVITSPTRPHTQNLVTICSKGAWLRMRKIRRYRRLFFLFLRTATGPLVASTDADR